MLIHVLIGVLCAAVQFVVADYIVFATTASYTGDNVKKIHCEQDALARNLPDPTLAWPLTFGPESQVGTWTNQPVKGPTGIFIASGADFKSGAVLTTSLEDAGVCDSILWTGLAANFVLHPTTGNCNNWTVATGTGRAGACSSTGTNWMLSGGSTSCGTSHQILCAYAGATRSPTTSPSLPTKSPTSQRPSVSPTTSRPSKNPTTSRPSVSPSTSRPTQSPVRATPAPQLRQDDPAGAETDINVSDLAVPIGVGVAGGAVLLILAGLIFVTRSRKKLAERQELSVNGGK